MKSYVFAAILLLSGSRSIMSMEKEQARLNFLLNHEWRIKGNSAENMGYEVEPSEFLGKKITEAIPLSDHDIMAITTAITNAAENQKSIKVEYMLKDKLFVGKITPIIKANQKNNFFLKVQSMG